MGVESCDDENRADQRLNAVADAVYFRVEFQRGIHFGFCRLAKRGAVLRGGGQRLGFRASCEVSGLASPSFTFGVVEIDSIIAVYQSHC